MDSQGNSYVTDNGNNRVQVFSRGGGYLTQWGSPGVGNGQFNRPEGVAVDTGGNVYVVNTLNSRVQEYPRARVTGSSTLRWALQ